MTLFLVYVESTWISLFMTADNRNENSQSKEGRHHCVVAADMALHF